QLPSGTKRDKLELALLLKLGAIYRITRGWTAPELERLIDRALVLCAMVGDDAQRMNALFGQQSLLVVQAKFDQAQMVTDELQSLYEHTHGSAPPISKMMRAGTRLHQGWLQEAKDTFEQIIQERSPDNYQPLQEAPGWTFLAKAG